MKSVSKSILGLALLAAALVGCSSDQADPNYSTKVVLTPEQQAQEKQNMSNQKMPGAAPGASPGAMAMPPGKGGK